MKKILLLALLILFSIIYLTACGGNNMTPEPQQSPDAPPDVTTNTPPAVTEPLPPGDVSSIKVLYERISWRSEIEDPSIIRSVKELRDFSGDFFLIKSNGLDEDILQRLTGDHYDEAFFEEYFLVLITVSEPSGSNRHEFVTLEEDNNILTIHIDRLLPEIGTADMAGWMIVIELSNNYLAEEVNVIFTDVPMNR